ncbi:MAG: DnaJ C-terminal domain-containing protein [Euryarchaeota archaeon]|nr:DnaJ C-terminal domain-containing protein [Euryarchaeota archaeon]
MQKNVLNAREEGGKNKKKKIEIKIPKGVNSDSYLRIAGHGEAGFNGGIAGDLYVAIHIKPHPIFERQGNDLFCKTTISIGRAIFGSEITIPTINGKAKLKIPARTQSHTIFKLKGQGMPDLHTRKGGDQLVRVIVKIPEKLNKSQKRILKEFVRMNGDKIKTTKGFFDKMKELI